MIRSVLSIWNRIRRYANTIHNNQPVHVQFGDFIIPEPTRRKFLPVQSGYFHFYLRPNNLMFSPEQKLTICEILDITPLVLDAQIAFLGDKLTPEIETAVGAKLTQWNNGVGTSFSSFTATESNKGFNLSADSAKNQIRSAIAVWFERTDWKSINGVGRLSRS